MNNDPCKAFKKYVFWAKKLKTKQKIHKDLRKYGQILSIQKSLIIKQLRFSRKRFFI